MKLPHLEIFLDQPLKDFCTFHIGGKAKYVLIANSDLGLKKGIKFCLKNKIKFKVIGKGANLLFSDLGFDGAIIVNRASKAKIVKDKVYASAGISLAELIALTKARGLSGLEHFAGIPSTLGGAIKNNAGAWGHEIGEFVLEVRGFYVDNLSAAKSQKNFKTVRIKNAECAFRYRHSGFKENFVITHAVLNLKRATWAAIETNLHKALSQKCLTQPTDLPSAGSVFKRTNFIPSKLIDEAGLKGKTVGGAQVSTKHAGFIVNINNATSADVKNLIKEIEDEIYLRYSATLTREIEYVEF